MNQSAQVMNGPPKWDETHDVVVVGSGASGCAAALFAEEGGAQTVILEKGPVVGGTSAKSGGQYWIPNNAVLRERGRADGRDDFLRYVARASFPGRYNAADQGYGIPQDILSLMSAYYDSAAPTIERLAEMDALKSGLFMTSPNDAHGTYDYYSDLAEDTVKWGRTLIPVREDGLPGGGVELITQLSAAVARRAIPLKLNSAVTNLIRTPVGRVAGVEVNAQGTTRYIQARKGVIFATGGYGQSIEKLKRYQAGPVFGSCAVPSSTGDFIDIGSKAGARLDNLVGAWRAPVVLVHAQESFCVAEDIFWPFADSSVHVNAAGRRCVNERTNYHSRAQAMYRWNENDGNYPDLFHFYIYDQRSADTYAGAYPHPLAGDSRADWVVTGATLDELANKLAVHFQQYAAATGGAKLGKDFTENLKQTVERFNMFAKSGVDQDFARGATEAEQALQANFISDLTRLTSGKSIENPFPNKTMHPLSDQGPYYAIVLAPGVLDTNGGPTINEKAEVIDWAGNAIPGLYGAGNCVASPARNAYWGAGATLGLGMTFGAIAGRNAAAAVGGV